jgi:uncharacterized protein (DUF1015 family)
VADVRPFRQLRYGAAAGPLDRLLAPPYDVISPEERRKLLASSPYNAVRLILPELPYEELGALIGHWRDEGVLVQDERPSIVAWTQRFALEEGVERERRTLLATVGLEPYEARVVRPHERTHAGPKADRLRLVRATRVNLSPMLALYPDPEGAAWAAAAVAGPPTAEATGADGTLNRFWRIDDPATGAAVSAAMADRWLLIADGHHRYETALAYRDERRQAEGPGGPYDHVMMGLTALEDPGLVVLPTHRLLASWPEAALDGLVPRDVGDLDELRAALEAADPSEPAFGLVRPSGAWLVTGPPASEESTPGERLDAAVVERRVLLPGFGRDQAELTASGVLDYTKDAVDAWQRARAGGVAASIIMRPTPKAAVAAVAEAGETMPQKSTYFFPKLLTGVAFHPLG